MLPHPGRRMGPAYDPAMLLAIDIGNTQTKIARFRGGALDGVRRLPTDPGASVDAVEAGLRAALQLDGCSFDDVTALVGASVVPALATALEGIAARHGQAVVIASSDTVPLPVRLDRPAEVGADRLVNALAALRLHGRPVVILDLGTATTVDAVDADGAFVGGAIAPGLELGLEALAARTARLPRVELRAPDHAIGRDTVTAIQAGAVLGYQALATSLVDRVRQEVAEASNCAPGAVAAVATGGLSALPWVEGIAGLDAVDPDLTLKGLAILHAEVTAGAPMAIGRP